jgi:hypothetical protein
VNARQAACLTTYILAGKTVLLEVGQEALQQSLKEPPLKPNLAPAQKLISHLLVRDVITGALSLQMVAIGERGYFLLLFFY